MTETEPFLTTKCKATIQNLHGGKSMKKPAADKTFKDLQQLLTLTWSLRRLHAGPDAISRQTAHQSDWQMMQQQLDWPQEEGGTDGVLQYDEECPNYTQCANTDWRDEQRCIIQNRLMDFPLILL